MCANQSNSQLMLSLLFVAVLAVRCSATETFCSLWLGLSESKQPCETQLESLKDKRKTCTKANEESIKRYFLNQNDLKTKLLKRHSKLAKLRSKLESKAASFGSDNRSEIRLKRAKRQLSNLIMKEQKNGKVDSFEAIVSVKDEFGKHRNGSFESQSLQQSIEKLTKLVSEREVKEEELELMDNEELAVYLSRVRETWRHVNSLVGQFGLLLQSIVGQRTDRQRAVDVNDSLAKVEAMLSDL